MSSYLSLLKKLYSVNKFHPPKVGLETMDKMYKLIGRPLEHIPVVSETYLTNSCCCSITFQ